MDEPAPMPATLNPMPAMSRNTAVKLTPAERSTARTSLKASVMKCAHGSNFRLTWLLEELQELFGIRHEGVHGLLIETALIDEIAEPSSDVAEVRRVEVLDVKTRRRHLVL